MVDVLELARQKRAELVAELKQLDWFLEKAEALLREHSETASPKVSTDTAVSVRPAVVATPKTRSQQAPALADKPLLHAQAPEEGKATQVHQRPVDTIVFKKMLSKMRQTHRAPDTMPVREKIAVTAG
ncbi:MAG: hypothetical protein AAGJ28_01325 [Pseudomonadota bacterium]